MVEELDERLEMVNDFIKESRELLDEIEPQIIQMEKDAQDFGVIDDEIINGVFRFFHSIKGMASFLDLQTVMNVTHEAETLLDLFRKRKVPLKTQHVDLLYQTSDFIRELLIVIEKQLDDKGFEERAERIIGEIQQSTYLNEKDEEKKTELGEEEAFSGDEFQLKITPEMVKRFVDEALEIFEEGEMALLSLEETPGNKEHFKQIMRSFHSFKGNCGFLGYLDFEQVSHKAESILEAIRERKEISSETISVLLKVIDALREGVQRLGRGEKAFLPGKEGLIELLNTQVRNKRKNSLPEGLNKDNGDKKTEENGNKNGAVGQTAIRVDIEKLDLLLDLVGEMVVSETMVAQNPDLAGLQLDRFEKSILQLSKIIRDIQDVAMSMRMIPLGGTFRKMVRLVRDLSLKINKKVTLKILGEETEVDKTIIEQISDPLVHIIRNAVDHGIEFPLERKAAGKSETGQITIEAKHSAGEVWIVISDDGKGLNREGILKKAQDRGLLIGSGQEMKDEDVWKLIFEPGLSTSETVSAVSGRGVGMDVVQKNIEKLRGKIDIKSSPGKGTAFMIRIPLTLAIIEGMIVRVGQARYTIPIVSITESFQPKAEQITLTPDGLEVVKVRGELLPVIRLHHLYQVKPNFDQLTQGILVTVEGDGQKCCLFVDELVGQQQIVIKGLTEYLGHIRGVSGFAILGDGEVSMILDIGHLISSLAELLQEAESGKDKK